MSGLFFFLIEYCEYSVQHSDSTSLWYAMLTTIVVTTYYHAILLQYHWLYFLFYTFYSHDLVMP